MSSNQSEQNNIFLRNGQTASIQQPQFNPQMLKCSTFTHLGLAEDSSTAK
uniref:APRL9 n=1 Tax=Arundo donax TaxID=35708 RepID=A0A0A9FAM1_ARUDO